MKSTVFLNHLQDYFEVYLPSVKGYSVNTINSYKDAFRILFEYYEKTFKIQPYRMDYKHISGKKIECFLLWLEEERNYSASSRNSRLAAISSFFKYASRRSISALNICSEIINIPVKKTAKNTISYFTVEEMKILLQMPNTQKANERRDLVLLSVLYDSGARVQELCNLTVGDIKFGNPTTVHLYGKGKKSRTVPLMNASSNLLKQFLKENNICHEAKRHIFINQRNGRITPSGVRNSLNKYVLRAQTEHPDLFKEKYSPHSTRHSKAMHMLEAGVDLIYIRDFLGHSSVQTTEIYAQISHVFIANALKNRNIPQVSSGTMMPEMATTNVPTFLERKKTIN